MKVNYEELRRIQLPGGHAREVLDDLQKEDPNLAEHEEDSP